VLNQSADYALRAVLFVAQGDGRRSHTASLIARSTGVPRNYLGKVLHALTYAGVLTSVRGPHGGFRLATDAGRLTLADVVGPFQRLPERRTCLLGNRACGEAPCASHQQWQRVADEVSSFFTTTTIAGMLNHGTPEQQAETATDGADTRPAIS
jgi:Rrf2 family protein